MSTQNLINKLSVVIPMHNEEDNVEPLINEVHTALNSKFAFEIVVVDDGSTDNTVMRLRQIQTKIPQLKIFKHKTNYGQSAGVVSGVRQATGDWVVTLDGDGQNDPADIPTLIEILNRTSDNRIPVLVAGNRAKRNDSWLKRVSSKIANKVRGSMLKDDCPDSGCGIKLFSREVFLRLPHFNHLHRFLPALYKRAGGIIINVPVNHRPRTRGQSKYGMMNRLWVGIVDLFGVAWLIRRPCAPEVESFKIEEQPASEEPSVLLSNSVD